MTLAIGEKLHGFVVLESEELSEIDGVAYTLAHEKSGAKLLYLQNDDVNKAFSISFKTPPSNDTGVFHILEHSVLCGSRKFPVKEPFVNLLKSSMQTFLNAMTFADKTMYPVASTNEQDLINLADVYMDAVLHPQIYEKRAIFEQEGWHYELTGAACEEVGTAAEDASASETAVAGESATCEASPACEPFAQQARIKVNGVVYNEMKGALSDPTSVLYDELQAALFPDTAYRFESGGTPKAIPSLTYEHYLEEHARHYQLSNSYLTLYGNMDINRMLAFLDEEYLTPVAEEQSARAAARTKAGKPALLPNALIEQAPVKNLGVTRTMSTAPENSCMGLGFVVGHARERMRMIATDILIDAIMGSNEAPLKRRLLDEKLADDAQAFFADSLLQPFAVIQLRGLAPHAAASFRAVVEDELRALAEGALDHALIEAAISHAEFVMREHDFGVADGVALSMSALSGWLYDDSLATSYLHYEDDFSALRKAVDEGYFEQLIREVFLENNHMAEVQIIPDETAGDDFEAQRALAAEESMREEDFARIAQNVAELRRLQEEPDAPEAVATLPTLSLADIGKAPQEARYELLSDTPVPCLRHYVPTRGIAYAYRYFDLARISFDDLPYVAVLAMVLGKLSTSAHSASDIDTLIQSQLGNLTFFAEVHDNPENRDDIRPVLVASASALSENVENLATLPNEIMTSTNFHDTQKIKDVLTQKRVAMEQGFANAGHSAAMARVASYTLPAAMVREQISGVDFYRFLKNLLAHYDECAESLAAKLEEIAKCLFTHKNLIVSFTGNDNDFARFWQAGGALEGASENAPQHDTCAPQHDVETPQRDAGNTAPGLAPCICKAPCPTPKNEAFIVPTDVVYAATGFDLRLMDAPYSGTWLVAARILSYDYLWTEVRVKGGAYGAGFQATRAGNVRFYSYRDPHLNETLERFRNAGAWLAQFEPEKSELDGYVISTVAGIDAPLKAREVARKQDGRFFSHISEESRAKTRTEAVSTTKTKLHELASSVTLAANENRICVFGNKNIIAQAAEDLTVIDLLNEK